MIFFAVLALNLGVGYWLIFVQRFMPGDAQARVANAFYVLFSRDPHLAAIGFVWPPLPSFMELPIVAFKPLWPALVTMGFAGAIMTAICGARAAAILNAIFRHYQLRAPLRWLFVLAYVLNPMILVYSANGMSEAMFIFFLLLATYLFLRWSETKRTSFLVGLSFVVGAGLFVRYELWLFAFLIGLGIVALAVRRLAHYRQSETRVLLYLLPVAYGALLWFGLNLVIKRDALFFMRGNSTPVAPRAGLICAARELARGSPRRG